MDLIMNFEELKVCTEKYIKMTREANKNRGDDKNLYVNMINKEFDMLERLYNLFADYDSRFESMNPYVYDIDMILYKEDHGYRIIFDAFVKEPKLVFYNDQSTIYESLIPSEDAIKIFPELVFMIDEIG
jgi:hypothetical protein